MKREDLEKLGLTKEQIDAIMAENGKDIEKFKTDAQSAKTEADTAKAQLVEANKTIEGFKAMNIDQIKASADDYKAKFEQAQADAAAQVAQLKFDHALDGALTGAKAKNSKEVKVHLDVEALRKAFNDKDGTIPGLEDQLKKVKESAGHLFEDEVKDPSIVLGGGNHSVLSSSFMSAALKGAGLAEEQGK
jgi:hypothetical protein